MPAVWKYTKVIRKVGSQPQNPYDGTLVVESGVRDQYASTPYVDTGLVNDTTYFYAAYAYTTQFVVSEGAFTSCHLFGFDSILENNTWEQIDQAGAIGLAPSLWEIGDEKNITVSGEALTSVILDFDHDEKANEAGKIPITFATKELMRDVITNPKLGTAQSVWDGNLGKKWKYIENGMTADLKAVLKSTKKNMFNLSEGAVDLKVATPTAYEIIGTKPSGGTPSGGGYQYPYFATTEKRIKKLSNGSGSVSWWWTGSTNLTNLYTSFCMDTSGKCSEMSSGTAGVCFNFFV